MILSSLDFIYKLCFLFFCVFLPCVFVFGILVKKKEDEEEPIQTKYVDHQYTAPSVNHEPQAIKVRDGYYVVKALGGKETHIQKMTPEGARVYWVLTLPGNVVEKYWTKKAAVASAIEKMKG